MFSIHFSWEKKVFAIFIFFITYHSIVTNKTFANMNNIKHHCTISIDSSSLSANQVMLNFSIENPYNKKMKLLMWYTPFEGFFSDLFVITHNHTAEKLIYQGPMVKRNQPLLEDYLSISANEVLSTTINLSLAYTFIPGNYQLKLKSHTFYFEDENSNRFTFLCKMPTIEFSVK